MSERLLLDEMYSPQIASELVRRGHDVVAVAADPALAGLPDEQVLEWAASQGRCLVTENVKDYEVLRRAAAAQGRTHAGLLYCAPGGSPATAASPAHSSSRWTSWPPPGSSPAPTTSAGSHSWAATAWPDAGPRQSASLTPS